MSMTELPQQDQVPLVTVIWQLFQVSAQTRERVDVALAELGLTESMAGLLWLLDAGETATSMRELARRLGCDPSNVTLISDKLQDVGLVERRTHPTDGRARVLALTARGRDTWAQLNARLAHTALLATLSATEQQQLSDLLAKLGATP